MTQMSDAFARAGLSRIDYEAATAALKFINSGGSREAWIQAFDRAAASKRSEDQMRSADSGHCAHVPASPPKPSEGHTAIIDSDQRSAADARLPITSGHGGLVRKDQSVHAAGEPIPAAGQEPDAQQGRHVVAGSGKPITSGAVKPSVPTAARTSPPPAREPSRGFINATIAANQVAARSVLHTVKTSDGRWWADVKPYEVAAMQRDTIRGMALLSVCGALNDKQSRMTFGELLTPDRAKLAFEQAQKELAYVA